MKLQRTLLGAMLMLLLPLGMKAQLNDPRETFSLSAEVEGGTNTDYTWRQSKKGEKLAGGCMEQGVDVRVRGNVKLYGDKKLSVSLSPFYHFSNRNLRTEWGAENLGFILPDEHHHYGGSLMVSYNIQALGKPLTLLGVGTGNFSQYGFENASGMVGGMFAVTRNQRTYLGLGAIYLLGTSVTWPLYPLIVYSHKFDDRWSINCMEVNNYLYYQASPRVKYALGMEIETDKFYFRPHSHRPADADARFSTLNSQLPRKAMFSQVSERFGLFADIQAAKGLTFNLGAGINVPFYGRLRESGGHHNYMTLRSDARPFVKLKVKYSLMR